MRHNELTAEAIWDHVTLGGEHGEELAFSVGDVVVVTDWSSAHTWHGRCGERTGCFPAAYVRVGVR